MTVDREAITEGERSAIRYGVPVTFDWLHDFAARAVARLETVEAERDTARSGWSAEQAVSALERRRAAEWETVARQLADDGYHGPSCGFLHRCTCGFGAALAAFRALDTP